MITPQMILTLLNVVTVFAEAVIGLRIILKLMGALEAAPFVRWVYETSNPLLYPFQGMFPSSVLANIPFTIEFSAIFALFAYMFLGYVLQEVIDFMSTHLTTMRKSQKKISHKEEDEV
ncbi:MAG: hypothetical protein WAV30_00125 [Microgenomates group bacterium]